jgi:hypothetical protein
MSDEVRIPWIPDAAREAFSEAELLRDLAEHKHAAVRGQQAAVEIDDDFLSWKTGLKAAT